MNIVIKLIIMLTSQVQGISIVFSITKTFDKSIDIYFDILG